MEKYDLIIVGGGACGLLAAGVAGEKGQKVLVLEKMNQAGRKLCITGKGRCNITNEADIQDFISKVEPDGRFLLSSFSNFYNNELIFLLNRIGIKTKLERGGRFFPENNSAPDVTKKLINWCDRNKVKIIRNFKVDSIITYKTSTNEGKLIQKAKGIQGSILGNGHNKSNENNTFENISYHAERVMLCTGGFSYPATGSDGDGHRILRKLGHTISQCMPSLVPLEIDNQLTKQLMGLELKNVKAVLRERGKVIGSEFGELTFINTGLSGPIILTLSRLVIPLLVQKRSISIDIDFKPGLDDEKLDKRLIRDFSDRGREPVSSILRGLMPKKLIPVCLQHIKIPKDHIGALLTSKERMRLHQFLKSYNIKITGYRPFSEAIITKGGVLTQEINQKTMESKIVHGLYIAGELLDLDGPTGGYNLQIAFSTAFAAANL